MKHLPIALLAALLMPAAGLHAACPSPDGRQATFANPVISADVADPTIIRWGDVYYAAGTSSEWAPHYPLYRSTDLVNWQQTGHIFDRLPEWTSSSFWAPELFVHDGKVFCYYTARSRATGRSYVGVATAAHPEGPYEDHGPLVDFGTEDIDAFVFDDGGQRYISWKAYGLDPRPIELLCQPLSSDGLHLEGEAVTLLTDEEGIGIEGQCMFRQGDWYYLLYAARGCCGRGSDYEVRVARSPIACGPYTPYEDNPILMRSNDFQSCGHGTLVDTPDHRLFYLCHAYLRGDGFFRGRQPILQQLVVGSDGWPHFLTGRLATICQPMPFEGTVQQPCNAFDDDFASETLRVEWTWNYPYCDVQTSLSKGDLLLSGTPKTDHGGAALCLRPWTTDYVFETQLAGKNSAFTGITFYGNPKAYVALGRQGSTLRLLCVQGDDERVLAEIPHLKGDLYLRGTVSHGSQLAFAYSRDGSQWTDIAIDAFDGTSVMSWDRISRPGLFTEADSRHPARFARFTMR